MAALASNATMSGHTTQQLNPRQLLLRVDASIAKQKLDDAYARMDRAVKELRETQGGAVDTATRLLRVEAANARLALLLYENAVQASTGQSIPKDAEAKREVERCDVELELARAELAVLEATATPEQEVARARANVAEREVTRARAVLSKAELLGCSVEQEQLSLTLCLTNLQLLLTKFQQAMALTHETGAAAGSSASAVTATQSGLDVLPGRGRAGSAVSRFDGTQEHILLGLLCDLPGTDRRGEVHIRPAVRALVCSADAILVKVLVSQGRETFVGNPGSGKTVIGLMAGVEAAEKLRQQVTHLAVRDNVFYRTDINPDRTWQRERINQGQLKLLLEGAEQSPRPLIFDGLTNVSEFKPLVAHLLCTAQSGVLVISSGFIIYDGTCTPAVKYELPGWLLVEFLAAVKCRGRLAFKPSVLVNDKVEETDEALHAYVIRKFELVGGSARLMFDATMDEAKLKLQEALALLDATEKKAILLGTGFATGKASIKNRLYQAFINPISPYRCYEQRHGFLSKFVLEQLRSVLDTVASAHQLLQHCRMINVPAMVGWAEEIFVNAVLTQCADITLCVRTLNSPTLLKDEREVSQMDDDGVEDEQIAMSGLPGVVVSDKIAYFEQRTYVDYDENAPATERDTWPIRHVYRFRELVGEIQLLDKDGVAVSFPEMRDGEMIYIRPDRFNFPTMDGLCVLRVRKNVIRINTFNTTISSKHGVKEHVIFRVALKICAGFGSDLDQNRVSHFAIVDNMGTMKAFEFTRTTKVDRSYELRNRKVAGMSILYYAAVLSPTTTSGLL